MCMVLEAYSDGGVLIGLPRTKALQMAAMTMMVCEIGQVSRSQTKIHSKL